MARASSVVSARAMAPGSLTQQRNRTKLADSCSATVAGFYAAVDRWVRFPQKWACRRWLKPNCR